MNERNAPNKLPWTLTEQLAADRTRLANERTLLAYGRAALGLIVSGTGFGQYLDSTLLRILFLTFIPMGLILLGVGVVRFRRRNRQLRQYRTPPDQEQDV
jgi:putative membrane protein